MNVATKEEENQKPFCGSHCFYLLCKVLHEMSQADYTLSVRGLLKTWQHAALSQNFRAWTVLRFCDIFLPKAITFQNPVPLHSVSVKNDVCGVHHSLFLKFPAIFERQNAVTDRSNSFSSKKSTMQHF